jgi:hypothetical protein
MNGARLRLSRPVYEGLPWVYLLGGLIALTLSYVVSSTAWSLALGLPGLLAVLGGAVVLLRRRGYRRLRAQYDAPDALDEATASLPRLPDKGPAP